MRKVYLLTYVDNDVNEIFTIRFEAVSAAVAREWFLRKYKKCVLVICENAEEYPQYNYEFED